jgi:hypothetical protein
MRRDGDGSRSTKWLPAVITVLVARCLSVTAGANASTIRVLSQPRMLDRSLVSSGLEIEPLQLSAVDAGASYQ